MLIVVFYLAGLVLLFLARGHRVAAAWTLAAVATLAGVVIALLTDRREVEAFAIFGGILGLTFPVIVVQLKMPRRSRRRYKLGDLLHDYHIPSVVQDQVRGMSSRTEMNNLLIQMARVDPKHASAVADAIKEGYKFPT